MYESFFRLSHRPFVPVPLADAYLPTGSLDHARQTLVRCLDRAEGPGLIVGPAGTGKSLLLQILAKHFRGRFQIALLSAARLCTRRALLQNILFELRLPYRDQDESELRLSLIDHLEPRAGGPEGLLLLVDEAHTLPLRLLEEIRLLTNLVRDGQSRVRLVLAGSLALEERLNNPRLDSFLQRIVARCYLQPLGRDETTFYVKEQLRRCGAAADGVFTGDAQAAIHTATDGIPRLINQLCDHALMLAALGGQRQIDSPGIEEAWADLQQLPVPLHEPPTLRDTSTATIVEFGQLDQPDRAPASSQPQTLGDVTLAQLDTIDQGLELLGSSESYTGGLPEPAVMDFSPVDASGTEVELIFHSAHDPFGGQWEHEEVVIDRYASLEDASLRNRRHATSAEAQALGAAVSALAQQAVHAEEPAISPASRPQEDDNAGEIPATIAASSDFNPASDPLLPEDSHMLEDSQVTLPARRATISLRDLGHDDRDLIVVEDDPPQKPAPLAGRTRRPEYRQLFSSLRNK